MGLLFQGGRLRGPLWFLEITHDAIEFNKAMRVLCDYGLAEPDMSITESTESRGYSIHGCVHAWTRHVLNETKSSNLAQLAMTRIGSKVSNNTEQKYYVLQRRLLGHAVFGLAVILNGILLAEGDEWLLKNLADLFKDQGLLQEAEEIYKRALKGYEKALGPDHTSTLKTTNNLGVVFVNQGRLEEAEALYKKTCWPWRKHLVQMTH